MGARIPQGGSTAAEGRVVATAGRPGRRDTYRRTLKSGHLAGLCRPLAQDETQARFWVRHLRIGVLLSSGTAGLMVVYALAVPGRPHPLLLAVLGAAACAGSPLLLRLPMREMALDGRGRAFFYMWSLVLTVVIGAASAVDGGSSSLLVLLFSLTLSYAAVAYPPAGVGALGMVMVLAAAAVGSTGAGVGVAEHVVPVGVLLAFVVMAVCASQNQWQLQSEHQLLARTLEIQATTDPLTGCLNRRAFLARVHRAVRADASGSDAGEAAESVRAGRRRPTLDSVGVAAVCLVDLDGFKQVNDTRGHAAGDDLLCRIAEALRHAVRETDTVARLGGDEFAVLTTSPPPPHELAERVRRAVARVGLEVGVTASVGVALAAPDDSVSNLLHRADLAMYRAKSAGGNRIFH
jgi:diguanylate cyclase (GGDEF)-like protein